MLISHHCLDGHTHAHTPVQCHACACEEHAHVTHTHTHNSNMYARTQTFMHVCTYNAHACTHVYMPHATHMFTRTHICTHNYSRMDAHAPVSYLEGSEWQDIVVLHTLSARCLVQQQVPSNPIQQHLLQALSSSTACQYTYEHMSRKNNKYIRSWWLTGHSIFKFTPGQLW